MSLPLQTKIGFGRRIWGICQLPLLTCVCGGTLILANALQVVFLLAVRPWNIELYRRLNCGLAGAWWNLLTFWLCHVLQYQVRLSGDSAPQGRSAIVLANHQAMADIPALLDFARRAKSLNGTKFFVKSVLKWVPGIGWGIRMLDFLFVKRSWAEDADFVTRMFARLREYTIPIWIINFPEGTRLTPAKLARSQKFARERGFPVLHHVLLPRPRGFIATLESMHDRIDGVYDCTIGFPDGVPSLMQYLCGAVPEVHVHVVRHPVHTLPLNRADLEQWLLQRFAEKDARLKEFWQKRHF